MATVVREPGHRRPGANTIQLTRSAAHYSVPDAMLGQRSDPASPAMNAKLQHLNDRQRKLG
jgi:hypothetical protein